MLPLVSHGRILAANGLSLMAFDLANIGADVAGGAPAWRFDAPQYGQGPYWRDNYVANCAPAVADGVAYAALASRSHQTAVDIAFNNWVIIYPLPHRCLYALDERTGDVIWSHDPSAPRGREDAAEMTKERRVAAARRRRRRDRVDVDVRGHLRRAARLLRPPDGAHPLAHEPRAGPARR